LKAGRPRANLWPEMTRLWRHDRRILGSAGWLVGIDEAGRGALAGPVVAAACVLERGFFERVSVRRRCRLINDSKQLRPEDRERQFDLIRELQAEGHLDFEVGTGSVEEIAEHNILGATRLAMRRAAECLAGRAGERWTLPCAGTAGPLSEAWRTVRMVVDGHPLKPFPYAHEGIVEGDGRSLAIAMASIAAKVTRDLEMRRLGGTYPGYGFEFHKGYGTPAHRAVLMERGPSAIHRALFLRKILPAKREPKREPKRETAVNTP